MYAIRSYYVGFLEVGPAQIGLGEPAVDEFAARITSYNVCYTKLLRLDGVCITDHDGMEAARYVREGVQEDGLVVIVGMEYATTDGDFLLFGPIEGLGPGLSAREVLTFVREVGGAAVAAHPFRRNRQVSEFVMRSGLCRIMELVNGRNNSEA